MDSAARALHTPWAGFQGIELQNPEPRGAGDRVLHPSSWPAGTGGLSRAPARGCLGNSLSPLLALSDKSLPEVQKWALPSHGAAARSWLCGTEAVKRLGGGLIACAKPGKGQEALSDSAKGRFVGSHFRRSGVVDRNVPSQQNKVRPREV